MVGETNKQECLFAVDIGRAKGGRVGQHDENIGQKDKRARWITYPYVIRFLE